MDPGANPPYHENDKPLGAGIGRASHEQRVAWGQMEYARQVELSIGIGGANPMQRCMWREERAARQDAMQQARSIRRVAREGQCQELGRAEYARQVILGISIGGATLQQRHEWSAAVRHNQQQEEPARPQDGDANHPQEEDAVGLDINPNTNPSAAS
jgi:hypothetical protein